MKILKAYNIKWDTDGYTYKECGLPRSVIIPAGMTDADEISDWLSDTYGFCHDGFRLSEKTHKTAKFMPGMYRCTKGASHGNFGVLFRKEKLYQLSYEKPVVCPGTILVGGVRISRDFFVEHFDLNPV